MITLPTSTISDIFAQAQYIFTDFWPIILLVVGLPLGFWMVKKVKGLFSKDRRSKEQKEFSYKETKAVLEAEDIDLKILQRARLNYESGKLNQPDYEKILDKYSK